MTDLLHVRENGQDLHYSIDDITRFHGFGYPGGVAHGFKVMQRALPLLDDGNPPERREISIRTSFRGPGARDAFEMVTRSLTEGRYVVDAALEEPERGETLMRYVFEISYRGRTVKLHIRDGHVRDEFIALGKKPNRTPAEEDRLVSLKEEMAGRLLATPAEDIYDLCKD